MKRNVFIMHIIILLSLLSCSNQTSDIIIYNASSTTDLIMDLADLYNTTDEINIRSNPAASGTLIRQVEAGGKADLFLSASKEWIEYGYSKGLIKEYAVIFSNSLAIVTHESIPQKEYFNLKSYKAYLSIGDPLYVPAGKYAKEYLENIGVYEDIEDRIIPASDVRAALSVVELGEVDYGIVYYSDFLKSRKVKLVEHIDNTHLNTSIDYYLALINDEDERVKSLYNNFLNSEISKELYTQYGFGVRND